MFIKKLTENRLYRFLVGLDDTDNLESRGTGHHARELGDALEMSKIAIIQGITRHQLLVHPAIPYTSHNSSACLEVWAESMLDLSTFCENHLKEHHVEGSDIGLCIILWDNVDSVIQQWGDRAKIEVLTKKEAELIASVRPMYLKGLSGTCDGIIGSLAAAGLRKTGNDGRFLWIRGKELRELSGIYEVKDIKEIISVDDIINTEGVSISENHPVFLGDWVRPVMKNNKSVLIVEPVNNENYEWRIVSKDYIKSISN